MPVVAEVGVGTGQRVALSLFDDLSLIHALRIVAAPWL